MSQDNTTVETQVNESPESTVNDVQAEAVAEPTLADLHQTPEAEAPKEKPKINTVPKARLDKEIARRKELEQELAALRGEAEEDPEVDDVDDVPEIKKLADKLEQIERKENMSRMERVFYENISKTLDNNPEYKDVVNIEVIKTLAFNPANANKTYKALLEEAYGNATPGRRTVETTVPRGGAKDTQLDRKRAETDVAYRREVLADPELRKQYNEGLTDRVFRQMQSGW